MSPIESFPMSKEPQKYCIGDGSNIEARTHQGHSGSLVRVAGATGYIITFAKNKIKDKMLTLNSVPTLLEFTYVYLGMVVSR